MSRLKVVREALAKTLSTATDIPFIPHVPAELQSGVGYLRPARGVPYIDTKGETATYTRPEVNLQAVVLIPAIDVGSVQDWLDERIERVVAAFQDDPTLGGRVSDLSLTTVAEPGLVNNTLLATELSFRPFRVVGLEIT